MDKLKLSQMLQDQKLTNYYEFIQDDKITDELINSYYSQMVNVGDTPVRIQCHNAFQRKIVHILAEVLNLNHGRFGCLVDTESLDGECMCKYCYEYHYRICGVWVSTNHNIETTKKDKYHKKEALRIK